MPYDFLSDEWLAEARRIRGEYKGLATPNANPVRINLVVTEVPDRGQVDAHVDTSSGELDIEHGHLESRSRARRPSSDPSREMVSVMVQFWKLRTVPPWTKKTFPVAGQPSVARYATSGEMLAGFHTSNAPASPGAFTMSESPGCSRSSGSGPRARWRSPARRSGRAPARR
jgi:hypothetical protein